MDQAYAAAIDMLMNGNLDFRKVAIELAKRDPGLFATIAAGDKPKFNFDGWALSIRELLFVFNKKVEAIKMIRCEASLGLKEAKDVADAAFAYGHEKREGDIWSWLHIYESGNFWPLNEAQRKVFHRLVVGV